MPRARSICFMVMPFSKKETGVAPGKGPATVDFDALWAKALAPAIEDAGFAPVRADQDAGALIILEMLERLVYSDLVIADVSLGNANVYYEIGVRHASRRTNCVMIGADWSRPLFDIGQMPRLMYPLPEGTVTDATAAQVRSALGEGIDSLRAGESPVFQSVPDMPEFPHRELARRRRIQRFKKEMRDLAEVDGTIRGILRLRDRDQKAKQARALKDELETAGAVPDALRLELLRLLRDCADWDDVVAYVDERFSDGLAQDPYVREQYLLALANSRGPAAAIGHLEELIDRFGGSSERYGLLGGRYKKLYQAASKAGAPAAAAYLSQAIKSYARGMNADLNDYYPSSNLPRLLRARGHDGDLDLARIAAGIVLKACERARDLGTGDEWLKPTLLGAAFDAEDPQTARALADEITVDNVADWQLKTTIADLWLSASLVADPDRRRDLLAIVADLEQRLPPADRQGPPAAAADTPPAGKADGETGAEQPTGKSKAKGKDKKAKAKKGKDKKKGKPKKGKPKKGKKPKNKKGKKK